MSLAPIHNRISSVESILNQFTVGTLSDELKLIHFNARKNRRISRHGVRRWRRPSQTGRRSHHRIVLEGTALLEYESHSQIGNIGNISISGIFLEGIFEGFPADKTLKVTIIPVNAKTSYTAKAKIVRQGNAPYGKHGLAMEFITD
tara:strand:- start:282 stop:719 length:438 start_codon:yes stop_codon:yes gene_type:complete